MRIHRRSNRTIPAQPRSQNAGVASIQNALRSRAAGPDRGGTNAQTLARPQGQTQGAGGVGSNALQEWRQAFGGTHQARYFPLYPNNCFSSERWHRPVQVDPEALVNVRAMFPSTSQQAAEEALRNSNNDVNRGQSC